jgi:manganese/zinc/iron transport system permease protein
MITFDYTLAVVGLGSTILGLVSGILGSFAVLRKQSLLGDAISHAALPGICLGFLVTMDKSPLFLVLGAITTGWIGALLVSIIVKNTVIKQDAALGVVLSVFFGFGLVLLTLIQTLPTASQSGLESFLFGSAATLLKSDVIVMSALGLIVLLLTAVFWKEFKLISFDTEFAASLGLPTNKLDIFLNTLIVVSIVIGLQTVGVVLMSALIIAPAAAARQWTDNLARMVLLSGFFGALSGCIGSLLSASIPKLPTGPTIVLTISVCVFISLLFAPNRGLIWGYIRHLKDRNNIRAKTMLANLRLFSERDTDPFHLHELSALTAIGRGPAKKAMRELKEKGLVVNPEGNLWGLTKKGLEEAKKVEQDMFGVAHAIS